PGEGPAAAGRGRGGPGAVRARPRRRGREGGAHAARDGHLRTARGARERRVRALTDSGRVVRRRSYVQARPVALATLFTALLSVSSAHADIGLVSISCTSGQPGDRVVARFGGYDR